MAHEITTLAQLRELMGDPIHPAVLAKSSPAITPPLARFIERAPFAALATTAADGSTDVSPRGDPPGFVQVRDPHTLVLPERPGNKRLDSVINIIERGQLSLLFLIPGVLDSVRVNGRGTVTNDPQVLAPLAVRGKPPELAIVIEVHEAFGHCSKALRRSRIWQDDFAAPEGVPTLTELMSAHTDADEATRAMLDAGIAADVETRMY